MPGTERTLQEFNLEVILRRGRLMSVGIRAGHFQRT